jgi:hypothetical protein
MFFVGQPTPSISLGTLRVSNGVAAWSAGSPPLRIGVGAVVVSLISVREQSFLSLFVLFHFRVFVIVFLFSVLGTFGILGTLGASHG